MCGAGSAGAGGIITIRDAIMARFAVTKIIAVFEAVDKRKVSVQARDVQGGSW